MLSFEFQIGSNHAKNEARYQKGTRPQPEHSQHLSLGQTQYENPQYLSTGQVNKKNNNALKRLLHSARP